MRRSVLLLSLLLAGCAGGPLSGRQTIAVTVTPANATCSVERADGYSYGDYTGPAFDLDVRRYGKDLEITCQAPGYRTATVVADASVNGIMGAATLTGPTAMVIGSATGQTFIYPETLSIALERGR